MVYQPVHAQFNREQSAAVCFLFHATPSRDSQPCPDAAGVFVYVCDKTCRSSQPGRVAQSVTCLATDACLTADPGVTSSIPVQSHTFVEIDHEMISTVILLPSADLFKKGCCQLQTKVCARITG